jgi:hypothetical protein
MARSFIVDAYGAARIRGVIVTPPNAEPQLRGTTWTLPVCPTSVVDARSLGKRPAALVTDAGVEPTAARSGPARRMFVKKSQCPR